MTKKSALIIKIARPIHSNTIHRIHLYKKLDRLRQKRIVWVSGEPGCGKTSLVAGYIEACKITKLWYRLDGGDADPATFFHYLSLAAGKVSLSKRMMLPLFSPECRSNLAIFTLKYFENLFQFFPRPAVIIFDDYQKAPALSSFHEVMRHGLSRIPDGITVFLISRKAPPPSLARLRANQMMEVFGQRNFRLSLEESGSITQSLTRKKFSSDIIRQLHDICGGWAAGLVMLIKAAETAGFSLDEASSIPLDDIFSYFMRERFSRADEETQTFLLKTAFLPSMTKEMAATITGLSRSDSIFSRLINENYFMEKYVQESTSFQYHQLYREFLLCRAQEKFLHEEYAEITHKAAALLEKSGECGAAARLLKNIVDGNDFAAFIIRHAPIMHAQGRHSQLGRWLGCLPEEVVCSLPWLSYWQGVCRMRFDPAASRPCFEQAFFCFKNEKNYIGAFLAWSEIINTITLAFENFTLFDRWISELEELEKFFHNLSDEEVKARTAAGMVIALSFRQPQHAGIEDWANHVLSLPDNDAFLNSRIRMFFGLIFVETTKGEFRKAAHWLNCLQNFSAKGGASLLTRIIIKLAEAMFYSFAGMNDLCRKSVEEGLELSRSSRGAGVTHMLRGVLVFSLQEEGEWGEAEPLLHSMGALLHSLKPLERSFYFILKTRQLLLKGEFEQVAVHGAAHLKEVQKTGVPFAVILMRFMHGNALCLLARHKQAKEEVVCAFNMGRSIKSNLVEYWALLIESRYAFANGDNDNGLQLLRKALAMGKEKGYLCSFADVPSETAKLCVKALEYDVEVDYVQDMIRKRRFNLDEKPIHLDNWPWAIKVFTLGRFSMVKDGKTIRFSRKAQHKPLALLKILIACGGRNVSESIIADILWPDSDGDMQHQSFATTLHRLRRLLGVKGAVILRDGCLSLEPRYCWVDVWALKRLLGQAKNVRQDNNEPNQSLFSAKKALALYKGTFLPEEVDAAWAISLRERVRNKVLRCVEKLGEYFEHAARIEEAIELYQKALETYPSVEKIYRNLMICYSRLDRKAEAAEVYKRYLFVANSKLEGVTSVETERVIEV